MEAVIKLFLIFVLAIVGTVGISLILSFPLMLAWNYVIPYLFALKTISWLQAWALAFVASSLIKSHTTTSKD